MKDSILLALFVLVCSFFLLYHGFKYTKYDNVVKLGDEQRGKNNMWYNLMKEKDFIFHVHKVRAPIWIVLGLGLLMYAIYIFLVDIIGIL